MTGRDDSTLDHEEYKQRCKEYTLGWAGGATLVASWLAVAALGPFGIEGVATSLFAVNFVVAHVLLTIAYTRPVQWAELWEDTEDLRPA